MRQDSAAIGFDIEAEYTEDVEVCRDSLILHFAVDISSVITNNAKRLEQDFERRYWLDKQGAVFGGGRRSAFLYHTPGVSSLEVDSLLNTVSVNLDYSGDHPFILPIPDGVWADRSYSAYERGARRHNEFTLWVGFTPTPFPRLMRTPAGFSATYVWTEHACNSDLRIQRAVYFGCEDISSDRNATGGFVKHRIPVTKSVFFANREHTRIVVSGGFEGEMLSIESSPEFLRFLHQLQATGLYDICLHCPQPTNSSPELVEESVQFMKSHFGTVSWIDHLVLKQDQVSGSRESFGCNGLNEKMPHFVAPIWSTYGIKYFWNHALEYIGRVPGTKRDNSHPTTPLGFLGRTVTKCLRIFRGILRNLSPRAEVTQKALDPLIVGTMQNLRASYDLPNPVYWTHPTASGSFYSWGTYLSRSYYFRRGLDWAAHRARLSDLANSWGTFIHHSYPARADDWNACWEFDVNGKIVISKEFDGYLAAMAKLSDERKILFTTIRHAMDYWLKLAKVRLVYFPGKKMVKVCNYNQERIEGLSMVWGGQVAYINGEEASLVSLGQEVVFWFDIEGMRYVIISDDVESSLGEGELADGKDNGGQPG